MGTKNRKTSGRRSPKFCPDCLKRGHCYSSHHVPLSNGPQSDAVRKVTQAYFKRNYRCDCNKHWTTVEVDTLDLVV